MKKIIFSSILLGVMFIIFLWVTNFASFINYNITTILLLCSILLYIFISWEYNKFKEIFNWAKLLYCYWKIYNYVMYMLYCLFVNPAELYNLGMSLIDNEGKDEEEEKNQKVDLVIKILFYILLIVLGVGLGWELYKLYFNNGGNIPTGIQQPTAFFDIEAMEKMEQESILPNQGEGDYICLREHIFKRDEMEFIMNNSEPKLTNDQKDNFWMRYDGLSENEKVNFQSRIRDEFIDLNGFHIFINVFKNHRKW